MKAGDIVRFLNAVGGGKVTRIEGNIAYVEDSDGFETPTLVKECVVVDPDGGIMPKKKFGNNEPSKYEAPAVKKEQPAKMPDQSSDDIKIAETPEGNVLNIVLAYEPDDIRNFSTSPISAYLVNDSNYYLYAVYATTGGNGLWTCRFDGLVEPNTQVLVDELSREDLAEMSRFSVQYVPFKRGKSFASKAPSCVEYRLDATKFYKLHCFHPNLYFEKPVIAFDIVKDDLPQRQAPIDANALEQAMQTKKRLDTVRPVSKHKAKPETKEIVEVDLHTNALLDTTAGLTNGEIIEVQLGEFRRVMNENIHRKGQKIVFIHGKGEGVLRKAILDELKRKYRSCEAQDASFREYGFGATLVTIH